MPHVTAKCWSVFDAKKGVSLYGKRDNVRVEVASLTKMMTLYTVYKLLKEFNLEPTKVEVKISEIAS
jgi:D-alanyl-D-alanine carboxypeptidase